MIPNNGIYKRFVKRALDFFFALITLIILSPLLVIIGIFVKVKLGSPVLFKQKRPGLNEQIFEMYKFRTMTDERGIDGDLLPDSVRLTRFGKLLRSTSLDELPELLNILKGEMSFIGPRPLLAKYLPYYSAEEKTRHLVRPGLSGLAQINGRNNSPWTVRLRFDVEYVEKLSFLLDLKIIFLSIYKVIKREGITVVDLSPLKDLDIERRHSVEN